MVNQSKANDRRFWAKWKASGATGTIDDAVRSAPQPTPQDRWYDSDEGVQSSLATLADFNRLLDAREKAGYGRHERLREFYVLARQFYLDSCGNSWKKTGEGRYLMPSNIPLPNINCRHCGEGWTIDNLMDTVVRRDTEVIPLKEFVGQTMADVKKHFSGRIDAVYFMQPDIMIRNDANIDLSPKYPDSKKDWEKGIVKNELGWLNEGEGITDSYVIRAGDDGFFNVWTYFHKICNKKDLSKEYEEKFKTVFEAAGFKSIFPVPTPNQYCGCDQCPPWYLVHTENGPFLIGWRKRVINIDVKVMDSPPNIQELFRGEDVTKDETSIHAWGYEKAQEYLTRIREHVVQA